MEAAVLQRADKVAAVTDHGISVWAGEERTASIPLDEAAMQFIGCQACRASSLFAKWPKGSRTFRVHVFVVFELELWFFVND